MNTTVNTNSWMTAQTEKTWNYTIKNKTLCRMLVQNYFLGSGEYVKTLNPSSGKQHCVLAKWSSFLGLQFEIK